MKKVLAVVGSRTFSNYKLLKEELNKRKFDELVSGGAMGADSLAERYAEEFNILIKLFPAEWTKYGKRAGYLRNKLIADYCNEAIVFWNGRSKGTENVISCLQNIKRPFKIVKFLD